MNIQGADLQFLNLWMGRKKKALCTAPVANYAEALGAESRRDFIHKMKLGLKELRESESARV